MSRSHIASIVRRPSVVFQPQLAEGVRWIVHAVRPTLGPLPRLVGIEQTPRTRTPELLDDAAAIARRVIEVSGATRDVGAMMTRHALWRMHELCGDFAATTAVLIQALVDRAQAAVAAGAHPAMLRRGIEQAANEVCEALMEHAQPIPRGRTRRDALRQVGRTLSADQPLGDAIAELLTVLGEEAYIHVVNHNRNAVDYEVIEGAIWDSPWLDSAFATDAARSVARLENAAVVVMNDILDEPDMTALLLQKLSAMGYSSAALVASDIIDSVKSVLLQAKVRGAFIPLPLKAPGGTTQRHIALHDIAALTGARVLFGDRMFFVNALQPEDVGEARRLWANSKQFGIIAGRRDPLRLKAIIEGLQRRLERVDDLREIDHLRQRIGQLRGSIGMLRVGAPTMRAQDSRHDHADRLTRALQLTLRHGTAAGGGAALLQAAQRVSPAEGDVGWGKRCLTQALEAPMAVLCENAGLDAPALLAQVKERARRQPNIAWGVDARNGEIVAMREVGIVDPAGALVQALRTAVSLAVTVITTDAVVHHRKPPIAKAP